jgi:hypothetical protein
MLYRPTSRQIMPFLDCSLGLLPSEKCGIVFNLCHVVGPWMYPAANQVSETGILRPSSHRYSIRALYRAWAQKWFSRSYDGCIRDHGPPRLNFGQFRTPLVTHLGRQRLFFSVCLFSRCTGINCTGGMMLLVSFPIIFFKEGIESRDGRH